MNSNNVETAIVGDNGQVDDLKSHQKKNPTMNQKAPVIAPKQPASKDSTTSQRNLNGVPNASSNKKRKTNTVMSIEEMKSIVGCKKSLSKFHAKWNQTLTFHNHTHRAFTPDRVAIFKKNLKRLIRYNEIDNGFNVSTNHLTVYSYTEMKALKYMKSTHRRNHAALINSNPNMRRVSVNLAKAALKTLKSNFKKSGKSTCDEGKSAVRPPAGGLASALDWRNVKGKSYVTSVKNQPCGTCWFDFDQLNNKKGPTLQLQQLNLHI